MVTARAQKDMEKRMMLWIAGIGAVVSIAALIAIQVHHHKRTHVLDHEVSKAIEYLDDKELARLNSLHRKKK